MALPIVAIVGAPNVGKSTLFNRMLGRRQSIVSDRPGVTRDRLVANCDLFGRMVSLMDTGGILEGAKDNLTRQVRGEALKAIEEADVILFVVDSRAGLTALDSEVARLLRSSGKPIIPVANKIDAVSLEGLEFEAYRLGLGDVVPISAEQGRGLDELVDRLRQSLPQNEGALEPVGVPVTIIGRPNVGKSSLFNLLVRKDRALVTDIPGTTRDPVDAIFESFGVTYRIIDTAGIRRRARRGEEVEWLSVLKARQALERARFAIVLVDAGAAIEQQDLRLLGIVAEMGIPAVVAANKMDLVRPGRPRRERVVEIRKGIEFASYLPIVPISALTGEGVEDLLAVLEKVRQETLRRCGTPVLNRALRDILREKQPPTVKGREVRLQYITQAGGQPPRFIIFGSGAPVPEPYRRFLAGRLRSRLGFEVSPVLLSFKRGRPVR